MRSFAQKCVVFSWICVGMALFPVPDAAAQGKRPGGGGGGTTACTTPALETGTAHLIRADGSSADGSFEWALSAANYGDTIVLDAGKDYAPLSQSFTLPYKSGSGWITIQSSALASLPAAGTRVGPSHRSLMPRLLTVCDAYPVIVTEHVGSGQASHGYRFVGVEITTLSSTFVNHLVRLGSEIGAETESSVADLPHSLVFERSYIHGKSDIGTRRGIALNAGNGHVSRGSDGTASWPERINWDLTTGGVKVLDSYFSDFKHGSYDTQALLGWNGKGPFLIQNNYLEGAGENVMFGGWDPEIVNLVPGDIEIRWNDFYKPLSWNEYENGGKDPWVVKNLFELKNAERVLVEQNIFENNWVDDQNGFAILFTPRNQNGGAPWSVVRDVRFERNWVRNVSAGINTLGEDDTPGRSSEYTTNIEVRHNLFQMVHHTKWSGSSNTNAGRLMQILKGVRNLKVDHNTSFQSRAINFSFGDANPDFVFTNNVVRHNDPDALSNNTGISGDRTNPGVPTQDKYFFSVPSDQNVMWAGGSNVTKYSYYGTNDFPQDVAFDSSYVLSSPTPTWAPAPGSTGWPGIDAAVTSDLNGVVSPERSQ